MAQLIEKDDGSMVDGQLTPEEVERLEELGVEVDQQSDEQDGSGGAGDGYESDEESDEEEEQSGGSGGGDEEEEQEEGEAEEDGDGGSQQGEEEAEPEFNNSGLSEDDLDELEQQSEIEGESDVNPQEVDAQVEAIKMAGGGEGRVQVSNLDEYDHLKEWERQADQYGRQLGKTLVDHFRQERKTKVKGGQRSGRFDSSRMIQADRGSPKVFKSENNPDDKKYHCVIALDDSGSMGRGEGSALHSATVATGMLIRALEEAGIEVTVYRFASDVRLVKSAAQSYDEAKSGVLENTTNGGTCLLPAIEQAAEIAEHHADETFLVTVTDGQPRARDEIKKHLQDARMKSITLQIKDQDEFFRGAYDGFVVVDDVSSIPSKAQSAFRRVML